MAHRKRPVCAEVRSWLLNVTEQDHHQVIPAWSEHMAGCIHCRGALMLLATELLDQPLPPFVCTSCGECQRDLAGYIDTLRLHGQTRAARRYPHVWWHLWTCGECAATLQLTTALAEAEASGALSPLSAAVCPCPQPPPARNLFHSTTLALPRALLARTFSLQPLGRPRGDNGGEMTLAHSEMQSYSLRITVSDIGAGTTCRLSVFTEPPTSGWVKIRLGTQTFQAPLDTQGEAHITHFPMLLLRAPDGPDLLISIHEQPDDEVAPATG